MLFTADHDETRRVLQKFIATEINPFVDEWGKADIFPAHELFKKLGDLGCRKANKNWSRSWNRLQDLVMKGNT
jgi:citronellyl-CoA dehydrogenase